MNNETIKTKAIEIYDTTINKFGANTSEAVHWNKQTQYYRFNLIKNHLPNDSDISILDVGCGNGEFLNYLNFSGHRGKYSGYDINKNFIDAAKKTYPQYTDSFHVVDILETPVKESFDYVILSGLFNSNYGQDETWIKSMLTKMFQLSNKKVIFNAISTYTSYRDEQMYYINPFEISDFIIQNLSPEIILEHGELPYNFQIIINKEGSWKPIFKNNNE